MYTDLSTLCVNPSDTIHQAIARMDSNGEGIVLVVDSDRRLLGTVTDGDVRRAMLAYLGLEESIQSLLDQRKATPSVRPITAANDADSNSLLRVLQQHGIRHLPLVDRDSRVTAMVTLDEFVHEQSPPVQAVIMAGGSGMRLRPLTQDLPKPMLPVGGRPLMENTILQLRDNGISHINITVHHMPEKIIQHFGDGREFGVEISYVNEIHPLGTAGGLGLMERPEGTVLVINGDIFTELDYRAMLAYHREYQADLTVAVQQYEMQMPYGVIECEGAFVRGLSEKPVIKSFINAGIYLLEPAAYELIPNDVESHMTDLIQMLLDRGQPVVSFPVREYWLDIGQPADYEQAQQDADRGAVSP